MKSSLLLAVLYAASCFAIGSVEAQGQSPTSSKAETALGKLPLHNFLRNGRPAGDFVLKFSRDDALCQAFLADLSRPRPFVSDYNGYGAENRALSDVMVGSRFNVEWELANPHSIRYSNSAVIDVLTGS